MRGRHAIAGLLILSAGLIMGFKIGWNGRGQKDSRTINVLASKVERFENYEVFANAQEVAQITGAPLYQVLTGRRVTQ
jgi:hypothetical protein